MARNTMDRAMAASTGRDGKLTKPSVASASVMLCATVYHIHEIQRDGVDATFEKLYKVLKDVDLVYVSFDIDTFDMSYAPGTGSSSPTGMSPNELFPKLREFAATKTIVGVDFVEFNPFYDNKGQQTARLVRRVMLQFLTGIAMRKDGIDPEYVNPRVSGKP